MIFMLEGPNGVGKSTVMIVLRNLGIFPRDTTWVSLPHRHWNSSEYNSLGAEIRGHEIFTALYRPEQTYVFDRWATVTSVVYNRIRGVENPDWLLNPPWLDDIRVISIFAEPHILLRRIESRPCCRGRYSIEKLERIIGEYRIRLQELNPEHVIMTESHQRDPVINFIRAQRRTQTPA